MTIRKTYSYIHCMSEVHLDGFYHEEDLLEPIIRGILNNSGWGMFRSADSFGDRIDLYIVCDEKIGLKRKTIGWHNDYRPMLSDALEYLRLIKIKSILDT